MIATAKSSVSEQAKATEDEIHSTIEGLISLLRDREVVLINDVETIKHQAEKELQLQKDELEFLLCGIRQAVLFGEAVMKEGSDTEIVSSHHQVVARMATLIKEWDKAHLEPVNTEIEFVTGVQTLGNTVKEFGAVIATCILAEQSTIETLAGSNQTNQVCSFKVILLDKKGNKVSRKMISKSFKGLAVEVAGPSKGKVCDTFSLLQE